MNGTEVDQREHPLWDRITGLLEQDLARRRCAKVVVEVLSESGSYKKEIGELCASERQSLHPALREYVAERLLDRYLAEQGYVDLLERRHPYRKKIGELTPADLPALIEADRQRGEEKREKEREKVRFALETRADLEQLRILELAET